MNGRKKKNLAGRWIMTAGIWLAAFAFVLQGYAAEKGLGADAPGHKVFLQSEGQRTGSMTFVTPEQFGARGDGVTDDTKAFEKCMKHSSKYVLLKGKYLITEYLTTDKEKFFYAYPKNGGPGATIICNVKNDSKTLAFSDVTFENIEFYSTLVRSGTSPHGEKYARTSNLVFVEIWGGNGTFENCSFLNALIAVRGRKSTGSSVIPKSIKANRCTFTECKIPIQGYSAQTVVTSSTFLNDGELFRNLDGAAYNTARYNGDLYSGDHCVYMEAFGCRSLSVTDCKVKTLNSESGASFQVYGDKAAGDPLPEINIRSCVLNSNGVVSAKEANVTVVDTSFYEQKAQKNIMWLEGGSAKLINSRFHHSYAFSYSSTTARFYALGCTFRLLTNLSSDRCNFPYQSYNCIYINWGGNAAVENTLFSGCRFTYESASTLNKLYISNSRGYGLSLINTSFRSGPRITDKERALKENTGCKVTDQ